MRDYILYKLHQSANILTDDILDVVLTNRGVKDIETYKNPSDDVIIHYSKLKDIDKAVALFDKYKDTTIPFVVDSDMDGQTSSALFCKFINDNFSDIKLIPLFHSGKQHGLDKAILAQIEELAAIEDIKLVIAIDAGTNDLQAHLQLNNIGIETLIIDHHNVEINTDDSPAVIVNNQISPEYANKELSGVGMSLKFVQALADYYDLDFNDKDYLDLVAMGMVTDSMSLIEHPETRKLIVDGFDNINNNVLLELGKKVFGNYGTEVTSNNFSFKLAPKINATIRYGHQDDKTDLFRALCGEDEMSTRVWRGETKTENLGQKVARVSINTHKRQNKTKSDLMNEIDEQIKSRGLNKNRFIVATMENNPKYRLLTGLVAGSIASKYKKPCLILHPNGNGTFNGSLRGYDNLMTDTRDFLLETGLFNFVSGHQNAAGVSIDTVNLKKLNEVLNEKLKDVELEEETLVDFVLDSKDVTPELVQEVHNLEKYWGKNVDAPLFAIENLEINIDEVDNGSNNTVTKYYDNEILYTKFAYDEGLMQYKGKVVTVNVLGKLSVNSFLGKEDYQVIIQDYEIIGIKDAPVKSKFGFDINDLF